MMQYYDWTKHQATVESSAKPLNGPAAETKPNCPLRRSLSGLVLRRMQSSARAKWQMEETQDHAPRRTPPRRCVSNEEHVFESLEALRNKSNTEARRTLKKSTSMGSLRSRKGSDSPNDSSRRIRQVKGQDAPPRIKRTVSSSPKRAPRRQPRKSLSRDQMPILPMQNNVVSNAA
ncbi:expressed unknown protein [Seminavis robusta]|uniref:Uncharacterized protein n=1 Tax=Seminavis robusta TaxID=568900 RepID=A0A9N8HRZ7_9STRA|nr:expressed unknown protein [Seminavis robusta]|eukprot:Sro1376_g267440.1 n/a (175) ;mRNA; f:9056-9580